MNKPNQKNPFFLIKNENAELKCFYNEEPKPLLNKYLLSYPDSGLSKFNAFVENWAKNTVQVRFSNPVEEDKIYYHVRENAYKGRIQQFIEDKYNGIEIDCAELSASGGVIFKDANFINGMKIFEIRFNKEKEKAWVYDKSLIDCIQTYLRVTGVLLNDGFSDLIAVTSL